MQAIRCNPDASEAFGMKLSRYKAMAFTIAAFYAGIGGALYAHLVRFISPESFSADQSNMFLVMLLVGGMGTFCGPIIGSLLILLVTEILQQFGTYQMLIYGVLIIFVLFGNAERHCRHGEEKVLPPADETARMQAAGTTGGKVTWN